MALEFGADNITANTVAPGPIDTVHDWSRYVRQKPGDVVAKVPLGRYGHVDEIAGACLFLAGAAGGYVNGQVIHVNGGVGCTERLKDPGFSHPETREIPKPATDMGAECEVERTGS